MWPTFRRDLETGARVDLGNHVVLSIYCGGLTAGWLSRWGPPATITLIPGDTSTGFFIEVQLKACSRLWREPSLLPLV